MVVLCRRQMYRELGACPRSLECARVINVLVSINTFDRFFFGRGNLENIVFGGFWSASMFIAPIVCTPAESCGCCKQQIDMDVTKRV